MGFLKNIALGGSTPTKEGDKIVCGDCRTELDPKAKRCPSCNAKIFTWRGRIVRRTSALVGLALLVSGETVMAVLGTLFLAAAVYYYLRRPIHYIKPPHRPQK